MVAKVESVTKLLNAASSGDSDSANELLRLLYGELRQMARAQMRRSAPGTRLSPTELVHEAYLRLFAPNADPSQPSWNSRGHFFGAAAQAMRNILVEEARRKASLKRGGGRRRLDLDQQDFAIEPLPADVLVLDELMSELERCDPRKAKLVLLHCFSGLTLEEVASAMNLSLSTIEREWRFSRVLIKARMEVRDSR